MKFELTVVKNLREYTWFYDTNDNSVYDHNGSLLNSEPVIPPHPVHIYTESNNPNKKSGSKVKELEINFGFNCNFDCVYCGQKPYKDVMYSASPKDVPKFVELLKNNLSEPSIINLWGGEPLVYWKTIKQLLPEIRKFWPNPYFNIITNGYLLTKDKIDFLNSMKSTIAVSYDCNYIDNYRLTDITHSDQVLEAIKYATNIMPDKFKIWVTLTKGNSDIKKIIKELQNKFGPQIQYDFYFLKCENLNQLYTEEERVKLVNDFYDILNVQEDDRIIFPSAIHYSFEEFIDRVLSKSPIEYATSHCRFPYEGILVSLDGSVYNCHIRPTRIGHISNINNISSTHLKHWSTYDDCKNCPFIQVCGGCCHTLPDYRHDLACISSRPYVEAIFKAAFARLFGVFVKEIKYKNHAKDRVIKIHNASK